MSAAEKTALARSRLDSALLGDDTLYILAVGDSSLILPLIEKKIEEVLKSPDPRSCFTDKSVDPHRVIGDLWVRIADAGDRQAMLEASKLLKIDEKRFAPIIERILVAANSLRNPFVVAYQGLDLGDPNIDKRILDWTDNVLEGDLPRIGDPIFQGMTNTARHKWAEALVERYGGVPTADQWTTDPIYSRLSPRLAGAFYNDVHRFTVEAAEKRPRK